MSSSTSGVEGFAPAGTSIEHLQKLSNVIRHDILISTTQAGSGHPTSSLSAVELMVGLMFGGEFRFDCDQPDHPNNDRLIFSKGHASPLFYALWSAAGHLSVNELRNYRQFDSPLEGHPSMRFRYTEAATGSLGQGLSIGVGMALNAKYIDKLPYRSYVLLGDSEMAEGSQWEAMQIASHYQLDNLVGVMDVNRLGQRGPTMLGNDLETYQRRVAAFGWETIVVEGHSLERVVAAYRQASEVEGKPTMIIANTIKGKGVSLLEDQEGWHGKSLDEEQFEQALEELGDVNMSLQGEIPRPEDLQPKQSERAEVDLPDYSSDDEVATRNAYGNALVRLYPQFPNLVALDGEVSNSTRAKFFKEAYPERFFEMYIAEQNMVGAALGLSCRGKLPFVSTFAAFFTRAFDQIRMAQYSNANIKFVGSHAGSSIGEDGPSQMGLEDIAMFRSLLDSVVLHPADAFSTEHCVEATAQLKGIVYLRTMRQKTPVIYASGDKFPIGGSKVLRESEEDAATVVAAGASVHEALAAHETLASEGIQIRVIDAYSIKPIDAEQLREVASSTRMILTVEDHYPSGGLADAVRAAVFDMPTPVHSLAVNRQPRSGSGDELRGFEQIDQAAIVAKIKQLLA